MTLENPVVSNITYLEGDATHPIGNGPRVIVHCCNDQGGWGSGFVVALSRRWPEPEREYRAWYAMGDYNGTRFKLGAVQFVHVDHGVWVANVIGQHRYGKSSDPNDPYVRYDAIREGLERVAEFAHQIRASVHMPRIGCGLAGGNWWTMGPIVEESLREIPTFVYDFTAPV